MTGNEAVVYAERLDPKKFVAKAYSFLAQYDVEAAKSLDPVLVELLRVRVSMINGCAFCVNAHSVSAAKQGEANERLLLLGAWREAPVYTAKERSALLLADEITAMDNDGVRDGTWAEASLHFDEEQLAALVLILASINAWNRLAVATRKPFFA